MPEGRHPGAASPPPRSSSRLDRHTHELLALYDAGATVAELQRWLAARRVRVHQTTVGRWLRRRGCN